MPLSKALKAGLPHFKVLDRWPATPKQARYSALIAFSWLEDKYTTTVNAKIQSLQCEFALFKTN